MFKMAETNNNNIYPNLSSANNNNIYPNLSSSLSNNQQFRLNKIDEIRDYLVAEIKERELMSKSFSKYIAFFIILKSHSLFCQ